MRFIQRQEVTRNSALVVRDDGQEWSITRDQVLAMLQAQNRRQVIDEIISSLAGFLEVDPSLITKRVLFDALQTGEITSLQLTFYGD